MVITFVGVEKDVPDPLVLKLVRKWLSIASRCGKTLNFVFDTQSL